MNKVFIRHKHALFMPFEGSMDAFSAGVFVDGKCAPHTMLERSSPAVLKPAAQELAGDYLYGGYLFGHYGHFLLESLSRIYAIKQCKKLPILFCSPNEFIANWQKRIFKLLGLENELILITKPTRLESLIISPPGCAIPNLILPEQVLALGQAAVSGVQPGKKIWLSRSKFGGGGVNNEVDIEKELANLGWQIVHPQALDIYEQLEQLGTAQYVAGFDGSAFYTALLAKKICAHFIILGRRNFVPRTLSNMLSAKGISREEHVFELKHISGWGAESRFIMEQPEKIVNLLSQF